LVQIVHLRDQTEGPHLPHLLLHGSCVEEMDEKMIEILEGVENLRVELMNYIQDLLKEVKPQLGDLSERDADIYTDIGRAMRQDQDEETTRGFKMKGDEEELRKTLNK